MFYFTHQQLDGDVIDIDRPQHVDVASSLPTSGVGANAKGSKQAAGNVVRSRTSSQADIPSIVSRNVGRRAAAGGPAASIIVHTTNK